MFSVRSIGKSDLDEIPRPEILDPCRVQRDHLCARCSLFVPRVDHHGPGRIVNRELNPRPVSASVARLCGFLELLEPERQSVPIRAILTPPRQLDLLPDDPFQAKFEKRAIVDFEQPIRDMDAEIRVEAPHQDARS
jgi:hypothetical protein